MSAQFKPSKYQQAIFDFIAKGKGSAMIEAVAGSGKTTTIVQALGLISSSLKVLFLAFNKAIAAELATRVPSHVMAKTFHSVGFSAWQKYTGARLKIESGKIRFILKDSLNPNDFELYCSFVSKLVGLAKNAGMGYLIPDSTESWNDLISHYDMSLDSEDASESRAIEIARETLAKSISEATWRIDFDDMLFMPLIKNVSFFQNDWVFVDERQDTNRVQQALLKRMLKPSGRLIAVGDTRQAIYGFRGADTNSMESMKEAFGAQVLPLSISYRCAKAVVKKAQEYVPHIEASETAPEGKVENLASYSKETFRSSDCIICRNTAPLVEMAYSLIAKGVGCKVLGREIGEGLILLVKKMKAKGIERLISKLDEYKKREIAKLNSKGEETKAGAIDDKIECLHVIINHLGENDRTIPALIAKIESMFSNSVSGTLTLCTAHKSKGLEFERVFILDFDKYMPSKWARQAWQQEQERNLIYVAVTRAKVELYFITSGSWGSTQDKGQKGQDGHPSAKEGYHSLASQDAREAYSLEDLEDI